MKYYGICPASCGEFVQGVIDRAEYLCSYAVDLYSTAEVEEKLNNINLGPLKSRKAIEAVFKKFNIPVEESKNISLKIRSKIPVGKGMASSTADIGATIGATLGLIKKELSSEEIAKLASTIEPTDSIYIEKNSIFNPLNGEVIRYLGNVKDLRVVILEPNSTLNTMRIRKTPNYKKIKTQNKEIIKKAFEKSIPIMCSYLFVSIAYGVMMNEVGFSWYVALLVSFLIYTGAFQFLLITLLSGGTSLLTIGVTALLMNSRQLFYSLSFIDVFNKMKQKWYMIFTMTDETYAVNCNLEDQDKEQVMFYIALFSRCYWLIGTVLGAVLGNLIPFDLTGIDFCMTALFIIIFMDQLEKNKDHFPAVVGIVIAIICLIVFGSQNFMLPSLIISSMILLVKQGGTSYE